MIRSIFVFIFFIYLINCNPLERDVNTICELHGYFLPENGYRWAKRLNQILCTCPDGRYEINRPCRICNREDICGSRDALCSEQLPNSNSSSVSFACFCSSGLFLIGQKCPEDISTTIISTITVTMTPTTSTITTSVFPITSTSTTTTVAIITTTVFPITSTSTTTVTTSTSTSTSTTTSTTTTGCEPRSMSSHLFAQSYLIILLNLVYYLFNK